MEKIAVSTAWGRLKKSFLLLLSTVAALCLIWVPSLASLLLVGALFCSAIAVISLRDMQIPASSRGMCFMASSIAIIIQFENFSLFKETWMPSSKVAALAKTLNISSSVLLTLVGLVGVIIGFYAIYTLSIWIVIGIKYLFTKLPEQNKRNLIKNVKKNCFFPISALAFFCLNAALNVGYLLGMVSAFGISVIISSQIESIVTYMKESPLRIRIISFLTASGICLAEQSAFYADWGNSEKAQALEAVFPFSIDISSIASIVGAVAAVYFVYFYVLLFWKIMEGMISDSRIFQGITKSEIAVYVLLFLASVIFAAVVFAQSDAFYGTELSFDIIYTSDSPLLVKGNAYLALLHPENDLRQPLFAVFAAPFIGFPYLIARLFAVSASVQAMLMNSIQIAMLLTANFVLAKMMKLNSFKRVCFMVLSAFTYTQLLFLLMMEQYIVAYFWLVLCLYSISEKQRPDRITLWGAGGTLLTSMILLPFMSEKSPFKDVKAWFVDMVTYGLEFVGVMLLFGRFDVIYNLNSKISQLSGFAGEDITMSEKFCQYTNFIGNCFLAPNAGVNRTAFAHISWQLNTVTVVNIVGILIFLLAILSAFLNRAKKSSFLSVVWIAFSVVMLLVLGWGTMENGLILYALYFGWAFLVLLFQLVEWMDDKLHTKIFVPLISFGSVVGLALINVPAISEMINFAITYYPV